MHNGLYKLERSWERFHNIAEEFENSINNEEIMKIIDEMEIYISEARKYNVIEKEKKEKIDELKKQLCDTEKELDNAYSDLKRFYPKKNSIVYITNEELDETFYHILPSIYSEVVSIHLGECRQNLALLAQFYGILEIYRGEEQLKEAENLIKKIKSLGYP